MNLIGRIIFCIISFIIMEFIFYLFHKLLHLLKCYRLALYCLALSSVDLPLSKKVEDYCKTYCPDKYSKCSKCKNWTCSRYRKGN